MNRTLFKSLALVMILLLFSTSVFAAKPERLGLDSFGEITFGDVNDAWPELVANLYAGQHIYVGEVRIEPIEEDVFRVTYFIPAYLDWYFSEIHFEGIGDDEIALISNSGGLIPGKFSAKMSFDPEDHVKVVSFTYTGSQEIEFFAAHAVMFRVGGCGCIVQEETAWSGCGDSEAQFVGANWSKIFPAEF
ncbi:hypothetical protein [Acidaminobacter hydrogenoformans]|uniref:Uncharacterized protein n=1 Tax=Acidaminobacter hydrogenoformans DSM 2784 TaxID=1120920 RepID=A0A1G5RQG5_9FIRM|nr:hypothetical protein [Acidaminobacter hydrogenoformans]SCZ76100.1 hypothetical protein SAMN03080599_00067 [Acidaminobacter hydrogenoformans DSM 2784]